MLIHTADALTLWLDPRVLLFVVQVFAGAYFLKKKGL